MNTSKHSTPHLRNGSSNSWVSVQKEILLKRRTNGCRRLRFRVKHQNLKPAMLLCLDHVVLVLCCNGEGEC
jgi:hypothetical protein